MSENADLVREPEPTLESTYLALLTRIVLAMERIAEEMERIDKT